MVSDGKQKVSRGWKGVVTQIFMAHPDWNATQVRREVMVYMGEDKTPGLSSIQKEWQKTKDNDQKIRETGLDAPWHLGLMADKDHPEYNIAAEVVPYILMVERIAPLTIREVLWVSRLYIQVVWSAGLPVDIRNIKPNKRPDLARALLDWARAYAQLEVICHLSDTDLNSTDLDKSLRKGDTPVVTKGVFDSEGVNVAPNGAILMVSKDNRISMIPSVKDGAR